MKALRLHITGIVQGVGFRPYVYRLATKFKLGGWVLNASDGVHVFVEGPDSMVTRFVAALEVEPPAAARIEHVEVVSTEPGGFTAFEIRESEADATLRTFISPDLATCPACLAELFDKNDRRYHYPFINCTDCGPRFTIIKDTPYDRPLTTMRDFTMCPECAVEYADPADRRFHAQPDACFTCGPRLYLNASSDHDKTATTPAAALSAGWIWSPAVETSPRPQRSPQAEAVRSNSIILEACEGLHNEQILAIKGLGGFQLACNARSETAVRRLRERKHRWGKPLALMFPNIELAERYCEISAAERDLLLSPAHPIVLLRRRTDEDAADLAPSIAPGLAEIGVMLPAAPLHHLLADEFYGPMIMTSGNLSEEPIVTDNAVALEVLSPVADLFLMHDRPIYARYDDSVVRVVEGRTYMIRRARGYAPEPLITAFDSPAAILAVGPEQKNTFTLLEGNTAFVSQHIGDLENLSTLEAFEEAEQLYERLFRIKPVTIAYDLHPEYLSTKWAQVKIDEAGKKYPLATCGVQHHHAHIVAACAEHGVTGGVIGIAFDGTGYGEDRTIWGGEVLISTYTDALRFAHLAPFALPGGAGAIKRPVRVALGLLDQYGLLDHPGAARLRARLEAFEEATTLTMIHNNLNSPLTSSMGRLFDAVAALLDIADDAAFEGAPAMLLEAAAPADLHDRPTPPAWRFSLDDDGVFSPAPVLEALLDDLVLLHGDPDTLLTTGELARRFHEAVVNLIGEVSTKAARETELDTVALSGGCFMNRLLLIGAREVLEARGLRVIVGEKLPVNDGCISFGQAVVAWARLHAPQWGELELEEFDEPEE
ncbi:MAG: carbamoyltransferase HypF [Coriobacteriia bacterium]|nr:carbamoyltransferase HypF [Coriobacteriia bacterium]